MPSEIDKPPTNLPTTQDEAKLKKRTERAEIIRKLVQHEDILQNYRFTWFSAFQALLLTALGVALKLDPPSRFLAGVICGVGVCSACSAFAGFVLTNNAYKGLTTWWAKNIDPLDDPFDGPPREGYSPEMAGANRAAAGTSKIKPWERFSGSKKWFIFTPTQVMPPVFIVMWFVLAGWVLFGNFAPAAATTPNKTTGPVLEKSWDSAGPEGITSRRQQGQRCSHTHATLV